MPFGGQVVVSVFRLDHVRLTLSLPATIEFGQFILFGQFRDLLSQVFGCFGQLLNRFGKDPAARSTDLKVSLAMIALDELC
jgi:hypothetical protein